MGYTSAMLDLQGLLKARLAMARTDLRVTLDRFQEEDFHWAPAKGMRSVGAQLLEMADKDREVVVWLKTGVWPDNDPPSFDVKNSSLGEAWRRMEEIRATTLEYIGSLSAEELEAPVTAPEQWWEALRLTECPRSEVLRNIAAHEWYHTGQLVTYLWSRGDDPYNW